MTTIIWIIIGMDVPVSHDMLRAATLHEGVGILLILTSQDRFSHSMFESWLFKVDNFEQQ